MSVPPRLDVDALRNMLMATDQMSSVDTALGIANAGVEVVAIAPGTKLPLLTQLHIDGVDQSGHKVGEPCEACRNIGLRPVRNHGATTDAVEIQRQWSSHADTGVAMKSHPRLLRGDADFATSHELKTYWKATGIERSDEPWPFEAHTPGGQYRRRYLHVLDDETALAGVAGGGTGALGVSWYVDSGYVVVKGRHPNGKDYYPFTGAEITAAPRLVIAALLGRREAGAPQVPSASAATATEVKLFLDNHTDAARPGGLDHIVRKLSEAPAGQRHDTAKRLLPLAMQDVRAGFSSGHMARERVREALRTAGWGYEADAEFEALLGWAIGQVVDLDPQQLRDEARNALGAPPWRGGARASSGSTRPGTDFDGRAIPIPPQIDDAHLAAAFAEYVTGRYLYLDATRQWRRWDGQRWAADDTEEVFEVARQWVIALGTTMFEGGADNDAVRKVAAYRNRTRLEAVVTLARRIDGIAARPSEFDRDHDLLNTRNGIVDLRTGHLSAHDPALRMTKLTGASYVPGASHPDVDAAFSVLEPDVAQWVLTFFGYAATGHVGEDVIAFFDGAGANGKTTLLGAAARALGDYAAPAAADLIMRRGRDEHPTIKADLQGRRFVFISETEEEGALRMEQLKGLTGGDPIKARVMRGDYFEFNPTHTLVLATNHRPYVNSSEWAAWRRLRLVPFRHTYKPLGQVGPTDRVLDPGLRARLNEPAQAEAALAKIVDGAIRWYQTGLPSSPTIDAATSEWRTSEDVILRFTEDCLVFDPAASIAGGVLYDTYAKWCASEGRSAKSNKNFGQEFLRHERVGAAGVRKIKRSGTYYSGVTFAPIAPAGGTGGCSPLPPVVVPIGVIKQSLPPLPWPADTHPQGGEAIKMPTTTRRPRALTPPEINIEFRAV